MKTSKILISLFVFSCLGFNSVTETDPKKLYLDAIAKFFATDEYQVDFTLKTSCDLVEGKKPRVLTGTLYSKGGTTLMVQGTSKGLHTPEYSIFISDMDKMITVQRSQATKKKETVLMGLGVDNLDVLVTYHDSSNSAKRVLRIEPDPAYPDPFVDYSLVEINASGWITKVTVFYDKQKQAEFSEKCDKVEIAYSNHQFDVQEPGLLNIDRYVMIAGNKATPSERYKKYEVVSNLNSPEQ